MINLIYRLIRKFSGFLSEVIKPSNIILFCSYPIFSDNAYAVFQYMINRDDFKKYKFVWVYIYKHEGQFVNEIIKGIDTNIRTEFIYKKHVKSLYYYYKSRFVFFTHGLYSNLLLNRENTVINLWHGMPLKKVGLMDNKIYPYMANTQYLIATSSFFQELMSQSFDIPMKDVLVIGQPRNDLLYETTSFYKDRNIDCNDFSKIGIWLPTYRQSIVRELRLDGKYEAGNISFLDNTMLKELDIFLGNSNVLLLIKLHPMDVLQKCEFPDFNNILIIKQKGFNYQLYPLLGTTDFLLTDYSSVWIDYEILSKPIGFVMNDIDEYKKSRGLTIENLDEELPGPIISNLEGLKKFITSSEIKNTDLPQRINKYRDNKSSERLINYLLKS